MPRVTGETFLRIIIKETEGELLEERTRFGRDMTHATPETLLNRVSNAPSNITMTVIAALINAANVKHHRYLTLLPEALLVLHVFISPRASGKAFPRKIGEYFPPRSNEINQNL